MQRSTTIYKCLVQRHKVFSYHNLKASTVVTSRHDMALRRHLLKDLKLFDCPVHAEDVQHDRNSDEQSFELNFIDGRQKECTSHQIIQFEVISFTHIILVLFYSP